MPCDGGLPGRFFPRAFRAWAIRRAESSGSNFAVTIVRPGMSSREMAGLDTPAECASNARVILARGLIRRTWIFPATGLASWNCVAMGKASYDAGYVSPNGYVWEHTAKTYGFWKCARGGLRRPLRSPRAAARHLWEGRAAPPPPGCARLPHPWALPTRSLRLLPVQGLAPEPAQGFTLATHAWKGLAPPSEPSRVGLPPHTPLKCAKNLKKVEHFEKMRKIPRNKR